MQITKVRAIAGRAGEKASHLALKDAAMSGELIPAREASTRVFED